MGLTGGVKYPMTVTRAEWITSQNTGSRGLQVDFECDEGGITGVIWCTEKSAAMAERQMKALGATDDQIIDADYLEYQFPVDVAGRQAKVETYDDEYKGKTTVKVKTIYPLVAEAGGGGIGAGVANLFRREKGLPEANAKPKAAASAEDIEGDIPFALFLAPLAAALLGIVA